MRLQIITLETKPANQDGPGPARDVSLLRDKWVQIAGGSGTHKIEISLDGSKWHTQHSNVGEGGYDVSRPCKLIRINSTGNSTPPTVLLGAYLDD